jgi:hypothetical protein
MATSTRKLKEVNYAVDKNQESRPGVPMESAPRRAPGVHWKKPVRQKSKVKVFKRVGLEEMTPVFGTAQPPSGISGLIKAKAYQIPEDKAAHWGLLLFSDRVNVIEGLVADAFTRKPYIGFIALLGVAASAFGYRYFNQERRRFR